MATLRDVALRAGVSITTASHALNKTRFVDPKTAERVFAAALDLSYSPNRVAQGLRTGSSRTIAVLGVSAMDPFFSEVIRGIEETCYLRGYEVFLGFVEYPHFVPSIETEPVLDETQFITEILSGNHRAAAPKTILKIDFGSKEGDMVRKLASREVEGFILNPSLSDDAAAELLGKYSQPIVLFHRDIPDLGADCLLSDDYSGMTEALSRVFSLGHKRIGMVYGFSWPSHAVRERFRAWVDAHLAFGLVPDPKLLRPGLYDMAWAAKCTKDMLNLNIPPTAIFYWSDFMAMAGMEAARQVGLKVPEDLSIVGFDDLSFASYTSPPLSTISQSKLEAGNQLASMLIDRLEAPEKALPRKLILPTSFVERKSTARASNL